MEPLCLHVVVLSAESLFKKDIFGLSNPYVKLTLKRVSKTIQTFNTKSRKNTLNPEWNEMVIFKDISLSKDSLLLEVFDANKITRDNFLGKLHFKLQHMPIEMRKVDIMQCTHSTTYPLKPRSRKSRVAGTLKVRFLYYNNPPPRSSPHLGANNLAQLVQGASGHHGNGNGSGGQRASSNQPTTAVTASPNSLTPNRQASTEDGWTMVQRPQSPDTSTESWVMLDNDEEPLPEGWEERQDANGRAFYVDHINRRTQWERPTRSAITTASQTRAQMEVDRRRQMAQTLARRNPGMTESTLDLTQHRGSSIGLSTEARNTPPPLPPRSVSTSQIVSRPQARPTTPTTSTSVLSPTNGTLPASPQANDQELPAGWEKRYAQNGRAFYIDHNTRRTQWYPPPAASPGGPSRPQSMIVTSPRSVSNGAPSPSNRPEEELGPLPQGWELKILQDGRKFFIDHTTRSTQWEDPRIVKIQNQQKQATSSAVPYSRDYKLKYENLRKHLAAKKPTDLPRIFEIPVRRNHLFEDSHRAIMGCKNRDHLKARLWVKFEGEKGLDYGGVSREWFFLLSHEMFNPYYGLFEYAASDNYTLQVNPDSGLCNENHIEYFKFIGRILAMAIYHQRLIDAFFIRPFYKMLLGKKITLHDMEYVDTEFYNSVKYILENDPEPLCLTFTVNREFVGQIEEIELKSGGADIDVTESNKKEYVHLLMKWRFENRINKQMDAIKKGFNDVIPIRMLQVFDEREIEYVMCGLAEISVSDWRNYTVYAAGYKKDDDVIIWFWKAVENFDNEMRARLLQFVTGTSKVPMNGFAELQGSNGPQKFCIKKLGDPSSLPRAHTCFNRIDLPPYRSYHELKEKLRLAVENTEGFEGVD